MQVMPPPARTLSAERTTSESPLMWIHCRKPLSLQSKDERCELRRSASDPLMQVMGSMWNGSKTQSDSGLGAIWRRELESCDRSEADSAADNHGNRHDGPFPTSLSNFLRWSWQRSNLLTALARVEEIPEDIDEILDRQVEDVCSKVNGSVNQMQFMILKAGHCETDGVVRTLEMVQMVPTILSSQVGARLSYAKETIRRTVNVVRQEVGEYEKKECVLEKLRSLPENVRQIADEATGLAVRDLQIELSRRMHVAVEALPANRRFSKHELWNLQAVLAQQVPHALQRTGQAAKVAAENKIEAAVAGLAIPWLPNAVVAEALLLAKTEGGLPPADICERKPFLDHQQKAYEVYAADGGEDTKAIVKDGKDRMKRHLQAVPDHDEMNIQKFIPPQLSTDLPTNPGSLGHPEMCNRPCLFFAQGTCQNPASCQFCHVPHTRRPTHLDKRNRELFRSLSHSEQLMTILPIVRERVKSLFNDDPKLCQLVEEAEALSGLDPSLEAQSESSRHRGEKSLMSTLRAGTLRSLLTMLLRMLPKDHAARHIIEAIIENSRLPSNAQQSGMPSASQQQPHCHGRQPRL
eukprot:TRINITY_DN113440_c0_g1_i1.p1 TRINITY_DN113440_c0_g1~~TRINITY_DN113440_c0_g1_i1.p1  ORF type:complete len:592 (+),score=93.54 TRINITY_DN113440_c0_g1_i1:45-1778(+)